MPGVASRSRGAYPDVREAEMFADFMMNLLLDVIIPLLWESYKGEHHGE